MDDRVVIEEKSYISSRGAAKISGYTRDYVGQLVRLKRVRAQKIGRSWYIEEKSFRDYISGNPVIAEKKFSVNRERLINAPKVPPKPKEEYFLPPLKKEKPQILPEIAVPEKSFISRIRSSGEFFRSNSFNSVSVLVATFLLVFGGAAFAENVSPQEFVDVFSQTALAVVSGQNPVEFGAQTVAVGVYETFRPAVRNTEDFIASLFAPRNSTLVVNQNHETPPVTINFNANATNTNVVSNAIPPYVAPGIQNQTVASSTQNIYYQTAGLTKQDIANQIDSALAPLLLEIGFLGTHGGNTQTNVQNVYYNIDLAHITDANISNSNITSSNISGAINNSSIDSLNVYGTNGTSTIAGNTVFVNGEVGIGTPNPEYLLDVAGPARIQDLILTGTQTIGGDLFVSGTTTITNLIATNATTTNATTTNEVDVNLFATNATTTNASTTNEFDTNLFATNATSSNFYAALLNALDGTITNFTSTVATIFGLNAINSTTTSATTTNLVAFTPPIAPAFIATSSTATSTFAGGFTAGTNGLYVLQNGSVGVATSAPGATFAVAGGSYLGGSVALGNSSLDTLTVNSMINSNLVPSQNAMYDLGSPSFYWNNMYVANLNANNISAANTTISGTQNNTFTINSDNVSSDAETEGLIFYRGIVVPNAVITWNSVAKRFEFNQPTFIQNQSANLLSSPTFSLAGEGGQTGDLFDVASSSGQNYFNISATGTTNTLGLTFTSATGTSATTTNLSILGTASTSALRFSNASTGVLSGGGQDTLQWVSGGGAGVNAKIVAFNSNTNANSGFIAEAEGNSSVILSGTLIAYGAAQAAADANWVDVETNTNANGFRIKTNGTSALSINNSQQTDFLANVGIGTSTPQQLLTLFKAGTTAAASPQILLVASSTSAGQPANLGSWAIGANLADGNKFEIASSTVVGTNDRLTIDGAGRIGLGVNSPANEIECAAMSYPSSFGCEIRLDDGTRPNALVSNFGGDAYFGDNMQTLNVGGSGQVATLQGPVSSIELEFRTGNIDFNIASTSAGSAIQNQIKMVLATQQGNLGLGTTSPSAKLAVTGSSTDASLAFLVANSNNTPMFVVENNGNTGIGTSSPYADLSIAALPASFGANIFTIASSTTTFATTTLFNIDSNGNIKVAGTETLTGNLTISSGSSGAVNSSGGIISKYVFGTEFQATPTSGGSGTANGVTGYGLKEWNANNYWSFGAPIANGLYPNPGNVSIGYNNSGYNDVFTPYLSITNTGNVGIGTTSPLATLDVAGQNNATAPLFQLSSVAGFATTTRFSVDNSGNVFIAGSSTLQNFTFVNATGTSATTTNIFTTNLTASNLLFTNLIATNATTTFATTTNIFSSTASSTNLFSTNANFGTTNISSLTLPTFTQGSVVFAGPAGLLSQDNANFFYNSATHNLGLGTTSPFANLSIAALPANYNQTVFNVSSSTAAFATSSLFSVLANGNTQITGDFGTANNAALTLINNNATNPQTYIFQFVGGTGKQLNIPNPGSSVGAVTFGPSATPTLFVGMGSGNRNVGIGTNNPAAYLNISSSTPFSDLFRVDGSAGNTFIYTSTGKVGIGTTSPFALLSLAALPANYNANIIQVSSSTAAFATTTLLKLTPDGTLTVIKLVATNGGVSGVTTPGISVTGGAIITGSNVDLALSASNSQTKDLVISGSTHNVGIGTTTPLARLDVVGANNATSPLFQLSSLLAFATTTEFSVDNSGNVFIAGSTTLQNLTFQNATGTSATTTNFFTTNASTTNLFANNATFGTTNLSSLALPSFTQGSVVFAGASGLLSQDNANFFYDSATHNLGLGTTSPYAQLSIQALPANYENTILTVSSSTASFATSSIFTILANGNVGIGTTSPSTVLDVESSPGALATELRITNLSNLAGSDSVLSFWNRGIAGSSVLQITAQRNPVVGIIQTNSANGINLALNPSGGFVGIGTTTPGQLLTLFKAGTTAAASPQILLTASSTVAGQPANLGNWAIGANLADGNKFEIASSTVIGANNRFVINGDGFIGIGVNSPTQQLDIADTASELQYVSTNQIRFEMAGSLGATTVGNFGGALRLGQNMVSGNFGGTGAEYDIANIPAGVISESSGNMTFFTAPGGAAGALMPFNNRFTVLQTGNTGVGTSSPFARLAVTGSSTDATLAFLVADKNNNPLFNVSNNGFVGIATTVPNTLLGIQGGIGVNPSQLYTAANGSVGVGTAVPAHALDVYGDCIAFQGVCINANGQSNTVSYIGPTFTFSDNTTALTNTTHWLGAHGTAAAITDINGIIVSQAGTLENFYVKADANANAGNSTFIIFKNTISTGVTVTLGASATSNFDTSDTISVVAGDRISVQLITSSSAGTMTRPMMSFSELLTTNVFSSQWITSGNNISYSVGAVGIGTTSPLAQLDVAGQNNSTAPLFQLSSVASFATTTQFSVDNSGNVFIAGSTTLQNFTALNSTSTNATTTGLAITGLPSQLLSTNGNGSVIGTTIGAGLQFVSNTLSLLAANNFGQAWNFFAGGYNNYIAPTSTAGIIVSASSTIGDGTQGLTVFGTATTTNLFVSASTSLQNFTAYSATTSYATTTNTFSATASSTNLFSTNASIGSLTANGLTDSGFTSGSVVFAGASGLLSQDNANFFYNSATHNLGLGTTSPYAQLSIQALPASFNANVLTIASSTATFATTTLFNIDSNGNVVVGNSLLVNGSTTLQNFTALNSTSTNATTTGLAITGLPSQLLSTNGNGSVIGTTIGAGLQFVSNTLSLLAANNFGQAWNFFAGGYNNYIAPTSTSGIIVSASSTIGNGTQGLTIFGTATTTNLFVSSSSTLTNFTFVNATGTNATTTNFFATNFTATNEILTNLLATYATTTYATSTNLYTSGQTILAATGGNVGIGTTTPQWPLNISSASGAQITLSDAGLTTNPWSFRSLGGNLYISTSSPSTFATSSATEMTFGVNGNVYIGTTTTTAINQFSLQDITGSTNILNLYSNTGISEFSVTNAGVGTFKSNLAIGGTLTGVTSITANGAISGLTTIAGASQILTETAVGTVGLVIKGAAGATADLQDWDTSATVPRAVLTAAGKFGIGTTSPWGLLSIASSTKGSQLSPYFVIASSTSAALATSTIFIVDQNGNVGIGTTSPWALLSIQTSTSTNSFVISSSTGVTNFIVTNTGNVGVGTSSPSNTLTVTGSGCFSKGVGATSNCSTTAGTITANVFATDVNVDLAESYYTFDSSLGAGNIAAVDTSNNESVMKAVAGSTILGIVSTAPGVLLGSAQGNMTVPVALSGRVPVYVSLENGPINIGDKISLSSVAGVGMKAPENAVTTVGVALEPFTSVSSGNTISVFVHLESNTANALATRVSTLENEMQTIENIIASSTTANLAGSTTTVTSIVSDWFTSLGVTIENNVFHFGNLIADSFTATTEYVNTLNAQTVNAATVNASALSVGSTTTPQDSGITILDRATGKPYCIFINEGVMQSVLGACGTFPTNSPNNNQNNPNTDSGGSNVSSGGDVNAGTATPTTDTTSTSTPPTDTTSTSTPPTDNGGSATSTAPTTDTGSASSTDATTTAP